MTKNLYIAAAEAYSGKSLIVLGIMNILLRNLKRVGIFRPIVNISKGNDPHIELIRQHFKLPFEHREMYGLNDEEAFEFIRKDDMDSLFSAILNKYKQLESKCDFVLIEGTDFTGSLRPFEFDFNARVANNLGAPIIIVINGYAKSVEEIKRTIHLNKKIIADEKCSYFGMFANRVKLEDKPKIENFIRQEQTDKEINIVIPELALLQKLTIRQISNALKANKIYGDDVVLDYDVDEYHIGAMSIEHILEHTKAGALVITPGDRPDVIISLFMTYISENFPKIAGILLTGGYKPSREIMKLITGIKKLPIAVLEVADDTYTTALKVHNIKTVLKASNERRMAAALGLFESNVEEKELTDLISFTPSKVLTP
ncbi:MAG: AAA family ATPase, partial [Bacteroidetes bacterium]|nr:AAA family ATPase [Bacteroidota bacterium]